MKRILIMAGLIAAFALLGGSATKAHADPTGNETCGGSVQNIWWNYTGNPNANWDMNTKWNCGDQKVFTYEVQHTTDGGLHWADYGGDFGHRSPAGCNTNFTCHAILTVPATFCVVTGSYRIHYWWSDGDWASPPEGAGVIC